MAEEGDQSYDYDVVVIGGGPIGLATAYNCAKAISQANIKKECKNERSRVLLLERFILFNHSGSTNDLVRMFRTMYTEDYMADLGKAAIGIWKELEEDAGEGQLVWMTGLLNFGDPNYKAGPEGNIVDPIRNLKRLGMSYREMNVDEIEKEYPFRNLPRNFIGVYAPDNGCINVPLLLRSLYRLAVAYGTHVMQYARVTKLTTDDRGVTVDVSVGNRDGTEPVQKSFRARKVALTSGAYVNHVLSPSFGFKLNLDIWEMVYQYYATDPGPNGTVFPSIWFQLTDDEDGEWRKSNLFYGFPAVPWGPPNTARIAVDNAVHRISDPDERRTNPSAFDSDRTTAFVKEHILGALERANFAGSCLQPNVYDNMFVLDFLPEFVGPGSRNVVVFTAGWAMKFIPLIGRILKDLLLDGKTAFDVSHFKIDRSDGHESIIRRVTEKKNDVTEQLGSSPTPFRPKATGGSQHKRSVTSTK